MKLIALLLITALVSCSNNDTQLADLTNQKKLIEDSISTVKLLSVKYENRMTGADKMDKSITSFENVEVNNVKLDSLTDYAVMIVRLNNQLKAVNLSIDSLKR